MRRRQLAAVIALTLSMPVSIVASVGATPRTQDRIRPPIALDDTLDVGDNYNGGRPLPFLGRARAQLRRIGADSASAARVKVGDKKTWLALDDAKRAVYLKDYKLRGIGKHIEVWVAADKDKVSRKLKFPKGDCRNGKRTKIRKARVNYLIDEFDNNIYPKESDALSVPPKRNGTKATLDDQLDDANIPKKYWKGQGDNIVVLVDNVRDANFYDTDNKNEFSYIAGFHTSFFNDAVDRNIMSIDAFDWKHRTGENPPNNPAPGNPCKNAPARPFLYEGTFAHEYHHLLESYEDPDEVNWVDEGLADWAQTLTGYVDPSRRIDDQDFDSHIQCFLGYLIVETPANPSPDPGGPENSLTLWRDQVGDNESELLCDYGAAYTMMEFLAGRYGKDFMSALHNEDAPGLEGLRAVLDTFAPDVEVLSLLHQWAAMVALDGVIDDGATLTGGDPADYTTPTLDATINWDNPEAYDTPGAPPNGSDYVRLRDSDGAFLSASQIESIQFDGALTRVNPGDVHGFTVQLVAYDEAHTQAHISTVPLDENFDGSLTGAALAGAIGSADAEIVAAIVTYDEPTESGEDYAPYVLTVNGVVQPGGS
jgi:hypothetical protein